MDTLLHEWRDISPIHDLVHTWAFKGAYAHVIAKATNNCAGDETMIAMMPVEHAFVTAPWVISLIAPFTLVALGLLALYAWIQRNTAHMRQAERLN